jgi:aminocarboxymuconate-semialdehyde decarboxylase
VKVVDVHTHMLNEGFLKLLRKHGKGYQVKKVVGGQTGIFKDGAPFMTLMPGMFDYDLRIQAMDAAGVDIAIVSLTSPNVYWGSAKSSLEAAKLVNDDMAARQREHGGRIRFMCSLPWQHPKLALAELKRSCDELGAVGVMVLANVDGVSLTDRKFSSVWKEIDKRALPVLVHPTAPPGTAELDVMRYNLIASVGFMFDTSLAVARMIYDGFFDRYPRLKLIASHGGGALPYLIGRMDICWDNIPAARAKTAEPPREYMRRIYVDSVVFRQDVLEMCVSVCGADNVLYGSDYPHTIGDMAGCLSRVNALSVKDKVRGKNAEKIFKL